MENKIIEAVFLVCVGIILIIYSIVGMLHKKGMIEVEAVRIDTKIHHVSGAICNTYQNTYQFEFEGRELITIESNLFGSKPTDENKVCEIYVDPCDPERIITYGQINMYTLFFIAGIALIFIPFF